MFKKTNAGSSVGTSGRNSGIVFLAVAVLAGVLAAAIALQMIAVYAPTTEVVVATREILAGEKIKPEDLSVRRLPSAGINADAIKNTEEVAGKHARTIILKASVLRPGLVAELTGGTGTVPAMAGSGYRAVPIPLDIFLGAFPSRGDKVDVIAVTTPSEAADPGVASTIIKGGEVLRASPPQDVRAGKGYILIRATPKEAELLALAQTFGKVYGTITGLGPEAEAPASTGSSLLELWEAAAKQRKER